MKYCISGVTGWMGRATAHVLINSLGIDPKLVVGIGSKNGQLVLEGGATISVQKWSDLQDLNGYLDTFFHYAFVTKDKLNQMPLPDFILNNQKITDEAVNIIQKYSPKHVVSVSSGAVYADFGSTILVDDLMNNPYGTLKAKEEESLMSSTEDCGSSLTLTRLWSLSGKDIQNTSPFALSNFILDAITNSKIDIQSEHLVFRRYVDARELASLLCNLAQANRSIIFDTGGPLVEIRDLAKEVANQIGGVEITAPFAQFGSKADRYYSESNRYEELYYEVFKAKSSDITKQVENTISGLKNINK
jgi:nucleoside-diphosphate-sugar epimerase